MIDERNAALYLDAMVDGDKGPRHLVFGLSLADGAVLPGWPVDMADSLHAIGMTFNPPAQGERGALTLAGDKLYVPYGGHFGECGIIAGGWSASTSTSLRRSRRGGRPSKWPASGAGWDSL